MKAFTFHAPTSLQDAVMLLDQHGRAARPIAGGQSLLLAMKERTASPSVLVSLSAVADLRGWHQDIDGLHIGSGTTYADLAAATFPGWQQEIAMVAGNLADRPVRTMGTIGGALCQADPRFDMPALAVGLDATMHVASPTGVRTLPAGDFFRPDGGTVLRQSEILTRVTFPPVERFSGAAFEKFRVRVFDAALVSVACAVRVGDGVPPEVRIAVGGVRPTPFAAVSAAARLAGDPHGSDPAEVGRRAADEVLPAADATTANATYQRQLLPVVVRDAVVRALATTRS